MVEHKAGSTSGVKAIDAPPILVAEGKSLDVLVQRLLAETRIAVDTESDSLFSYFEKVCVVQISTSAVDYVVDPLALPRASGDSEGGGLLALGPVFERAQIEKVFHAVEYDILCLKRDYHFTFHNIFDTMIAARILGWKNVGLGNILQEHFGVTLNKKMQRADWGRRPLSAEQISYAREDTHYLLALRELQAAELTRLDRMEEAREEFERLTHVEPASHRFDPDAYWNIAGARDLDRVGLGVLRELSRFRDFQARKENRPAFKIMADKTMLEIAASRPASAHELGAVKGVTEYTTQKFGQGILGAVARGLAEPQKTIPRPHSRGQPPLDNGARERLGRLKEWRKQRAQSRGVEPDVIVSNDVLFAAARRVPRSVEALVTTCELGKWKAQAYGQEILSVLNGS
jgi:ribonuclease D